MARGGKRPGAGRKPGSVNKRLSVLPGKVSVRGMSPIDLMKHAAEKLADAEDWTNLAMVAARLAPYVHPKMPTLVQQGARHADQKLQDDLFDTPRPATAGQPSTSAPDEFDGLLN